MSIRPFTEGMTAHRYTDEQIAEFGHHRAGRLEGQKAFTKAANEGYDGEDCMIFYNKAYDEAYEKHKAG